jgi:hypothetical protein
MKIFNIPTQVQNMHIVISSDCLQNAEIEMSRYPLYAASNIIEMDISDWLEYVRLHQTKCIKPFQI